MIHLPPARIYEWMIDPLLRFNHQLVAGIIEENSTVLDLACGNGTLAFMLAQKAKKVTGIDISEEKISYAVSRIGKKRHQNIEFLCHDAKELDSLGNQRIDYATISMALHQFSPDVAVRIVKDLKHLCPRIIIMDYAYPLPGGFPGTVTRMIERMAGKEHNENFKKYLHLGGSWKIAELCGLKVNSASGRSVFSVIECEVPGKEKNNTQGVLF